MWPASLLGVVAAATFLFLRPPAWFPLAITPEALQYDGQLQRTLWVSIGLFLALHFVLFVLSLHRRGRTPVAPRHTFPYAEPLAAVLAFVLFTGLALTGTRVWAAVHANPLRPDAIQIEVMAHQFAWSFRYAGADSTFGRISPSHANDVTGNSFGLDPGDPAAADDVTTASLKVPVDRDIVLTLRARDVIHCFFVRELRLKQDAVPGMSIPYRFHPTQTGTFEIACSELCGIGHSQMRATLEVMPAEQYRKWLQSQSPAR